MNFLFTKNPNQFFFFFFLGGGGGATVSEFSFFLLLRIQIENKFFRRGVGLEGGVE